MMPRSLRRPPSPALLILLGLVLLGGCGFQPRGQSVSLSGVPGPVHLSGIRPYSPLAREPRRQLDRAGLAVAEAAADSGSVLRLSRRDRNSRVLSVDSRNKAVEYELEEAVEFGLYLRSGEELVPPQTVRVLRILLRPPNAILGANREEELLREDMRRELAERIVHRLSAQR